MWKNTYPDPLSRLQTSKFSMTGFYVTISFICQVHVCVYMQQILYDKFSYDKFYLLVWTCQQVYFDNLLVASWPITTNA